MAFGIPGSEPASGNFLGRIQYDSRNGFWKVVKRVQDSAGVWSDRVGEDFKNPTMLFDFGSLEVGYLKFSSPPAFVLVPYGHAIPQQPQELTDEKRKAFQPGFRVKVASAKIFGDAEAYHWAHNAKTVIEPMDELYKLFEQQPEAAAGKVPLIAVTGTRIIEIQKNRYHAPVFAIQAWYDRLEVFGERTVPAPAPRSAPAMNAQAAQVMAAKPIPTETQGWGAPSAGPVTPPVAQPAPSAAAPPAGMPF